MIELYYLPSLRMSIHLPSQRRKAPVSSSGDSAAAANPETSAVQIPAVNRFHPGGEKDIV